MMSCGKSTRDHALQFISPSKRRRKKKIRKRIKKTKKRLRMKKEQLQRKTLMMTETRSSLVPPSKNVKSLCCPLWTGSLNQLIRYALSSMI
jgi:hypothetical protein